MGAVYWQLNDCWPVTSWSSIDYYGRWKALHYYAKRFFSPVMISCEEQSWMTAAKDMNRQHFAFEKSIRLNVTNETMEEKQAGKAMEIIESGVKESVPNNSNGHIIIAYEPRWAIGAGITPTHEEIEQAHSLIAKTLHSLELDETPILYGASVNGLNAGDIMSLNNVDGVLVGGASLKPDDFISIITSIK